MTVDIDAIETMYGPCRLASHGRCVGNHDPGVLAAMDELRRLREENRWIPVGERLPEEAGRYLAVAADGDVDSCWFDEHVFSEYGYDTDVTHWRPRPAPPEVKG